MDIAIGVDPEHVAMGFQGIVNFHFGLVASANKGTAGGVRELDGDEEVVDMQELAFDVFPAGQSNGGRYSSALGGIGIFNGAMSLTAFATEEGVLNVFWIGDASRETFQVAGDGVAGGALDGEVGLTLFGVAHEDIGSDFAGRRRRALHADGFENAVDKGDNREPVFRADRDSRHARILTRALDDGQDFLAVLIGERDLRAEQVGSAHIAATKVGSVTDGAIDSINGFAARDFSGIFRGAVLSGDESTDAMRGNYQRRRRRRS